MILPRCLPRLLSFSSEGHVRKKALSLHWVLKEYYYIANVTFICVRFCPTHWRKRWARWEYQVAVFLSCTRIYFLLARCPCCSILNLESFPEMSPVVPCSLLYVIKKKPKGLKESAWVTGMCTHQLNMGHCFLLDGLICQGDGQHLMFVLLTNQQMSDLWMGSIS